MAKLVFEKISTETEGSLNEQEFEIGNTAIVMEILRDKLYADPIVAVVREYSCNAWDAMVEVGKGDQPIEITLPSENDNNFIIKDYGPGLSPARMDQIFRKYGNSTKRDTNDQIGSFGMGSKSGWAYSDTFSIITNYNKIQYVYSCYLDESRKGKLVLLGESETSEPNGTSIIIPVKRKDHAAFTNAVAKITQYWEIKPLVYRTNNTEKLQAYLNYDIEETILSGSDWYIVKKANSYNYYQSPKVIIGGIGYNINSDPFTKLKSSLHDFIFRNNFRFKFQNGDLSLNAGRDSLHTDARTIKVLTERFERVAKEYSDHVKKQIEKSTSYRNAYKILAELDHNIQYKPLDNLDLTWNNIPIYKSFKFSSDIFENIEVVNYNLVKNRRKNLDEVVTKNITEDNPRCRLADWSVHPEIETFKFYFNDLNVKSKPYAESVLKNVTTDRLSVWVLTLAEGASLTPAQKTLIDNLCENLSSIKLEVFEKVKTQRKKAEKENILAYASFSNKDIVEIPKDLGGVYYIKNNNYIEDLSNNRIPFTVETFRLLNKFLTCKVYGFTQTRAESLPDNWVSYHDALKNKIKEYEKEHGSLKYIFECHAAASITSLPYVISSNRLNILKKIKKDGLIAEYFAILDKCQPVIDKTHILVKIIESFEIEPDYKDCLWQGSDSFKKVNSIYNQLNDIYKKISKHYPLIYFLDSRCEVKHVIDYINLIDI